MDGTTDHPSLRDMLDVEIPNEAALDPQGGYVDPYRAAYGEIQRGLRRHQVESILDEIQHRIRLVTDRRERAGGSPEGHVYRTLTTRLDALEMAESIATQQLFPAYVYGSGPVDGVGPLAGTVACRYPGCQERLSRTFSFTSGGACAWCHAAHQEQRRRNG